MDSVIHGSPPRGSECSELLLSTIMEKKLLNHRYQIFKRLRLKFAVLSQSPVAAERHRGSIIYGATKISCVLDKGYNSEKIRRIRQENGMASDVRTQKRATEKYLKGNRNPNLLDRRFRL